MFNFKTLELCPWPAHVSTQIRWARESRSCARPSSLQAWAGLCVCQAWQGVPRAQDQLLGGDWACLLPARVLGGSSGLWHSWALRLHAFLFQLRCRLPVWTGAPEQRGRRRHNDLGHLGDVGRPAWDIAATLCYLQAMLSLSPPPPSTPQTWPCEGVPGARPSSGDTSLLCNSHEPDLCKTNKNFLIRPKRKKRMSLCFRIWDMQSPSLAWRSRLALPIVMTKIGLYIQAWASPEMFINRPWVIQGGKNCVEKMVFQETVTARVWCCTL